MDDWARGDRTRNYAWKWNYDAHELQQQTEKYCGMIGTLRELLMSFLFSLGRNMIIFLWDIWAVAKWVEAGEGLDNKWEETTRTWGTRLLTIAFKQKKSKVKFLLGSPSSIVCCSSSSLLIVHTAQRSFDLSRPHEWAEWASLSHFLAISLPLNSRARSSSTFNWFSQLT